MNNENENKYYIYAWYYINTDEIFYIGKGLNNRYIDTKGSRNEYFKNIIRKEGNNANVKKLYENLSEEESYRLERELIHKYWDKGECKANFHEGGRGGNHGNYNENMRKKLSEFASTRTGEKNSMWKHKYTPEQLEKMSNSQKTSIKAYKWTHSERHSKISSENAKRLNTDPKYEEYRIKRKEIWTNYAKQPKTPEQIQYNRDRQCLNNYICKLNNEVIYETRYRKDLIKFCEDNLNISRTIFFQVLNNNWTPKFKKHEHLKTLQIITEINKYKGVSTTPDECKEVE